MGQATKSELRYVYAITREKFLKRLNEKSPMEKDDLDYLRGLLFAITIMMKQKFIILNVMKS